MPDYNSEASNVWDALKPAIDGEIDQRTRGMVQRRKAKVTTAPSLVTNKIGVTEPYGTEIFIPFVSNLASAVVGDYVWVEFMYGANNSFASMFASADSKDQTVAGNLTVGGVLDVTQRRCYGTVSSQGWYRIIQYDAIGNAEAIGDYGRIFNIRLVRRYNDGNNEVHKITLMNPYNVFKFTDETSVSNGFFFTKIRATYNSTTHKTYIDVYYDSTRSNNVAAFFDVYSAEPDALARAVSVPFTNVSAAPSGETVLTEYTFLANGSQVSNLTVNGILDVTQRRNWNIFSQAGWYRVMKIDGGRAAWSFSIDFDITRVYNNANNEVHSVKMLETYNAIPLFTNEVSKTNTLVVSKIRYTLDSNNVGYVDIRYDSNTANTVTVDFTVHTNPNRQQYFTVTPFQSVADAPSGETVLTEYTFAVNTVEPMRPVTFSISGNSNKVITVSGATEGAWLVSTNGWQVGINGLYAMSGYSTGSRTTVATLMNCANITIDTASYTGSFQFKITNSGNNAATVQIVPLTPGLTFA